MKDWELSFGFYPGILTGFRTYREEGKSNHVLYIQAAREELMEQSAKSKVLVTDGDYEDEDED